MSLSQSGDTERFIVPLIAIFAVSLALANVLAAKLAWFVLPGIGGVAVPAGFLAIGVGFLATDLLSELAGPKTARRTVNGTILALVAGWVLIYTAIWMPAAPFYEGGEAFRTTLGSSATIILASIVSLLFSQNVDVSVFHRIRQETDYRFARNIGSTAVSQLIDTTLFILLGFVIFPMFTSAPSQSLGAAGSLIIGQYIVKLVVALGDTPLFYLISELASRTEAETPAMSD
jgi:uncharacterized integral membrane protein (TIGR00697 family)